MDRRKNPVLHHCSRLYRSALKYVKIKHINNNLVTLSLVSPTEQKVIVKFKNNACLDTVRRSIALQTCIPERRICLYKSGLELDPDMTIKETGLLDNDILNWTVGDSLKDASTKAKVFCIGLFKTGTSSVSKALDILGYRSYHKFGGKFIVDWDDYWNVDDSTAFAPHFRDIKNFVSLYDGFGDAPWMYLYKELDQWFPGSKFILTVRDAESLADSEINQCLRYGSTPESKQRYIDRYIRHNQNVKDYFRSWTHNLLVFDVRSGWPNLCKFLERDIPIVQFPHENKRP